MKNFVQKGDVIDYVNGGSTTIASGTVVVVGSLLGVAVSDIEASATGALRISGAVNLKKKKATAVTAGQALDYDISASQLDAIGAPASGDLVGCCVAIAGAGATEGTVTVLLNVAGATISAGQ